MIGGGTYFARDLADQPLDAATEFYTKIVPLIRQDFKIMPEFNVTVVFHPAQHGHRAWRLAAIQELAREAAPAGRVNGIVADCAEVSVALEDGGIRDAIEWLQQAPGITGQLLEVS